MYLTSYLPRLLFCLCPSGGRPQHRGVALRTVKARPASAGEILFVRSTSEICASTRFWNRTKASKQHSSATPPPPPHHSLPHPPLASYTIFRFMLRCTCCRTTRLEGLLTGRQGSTPNAKHGSSKDQDPDIRVPTAVLALRNRWLVELPSRQHRSNAWQR